MSFFDITRKTVSSNADMFSWVGVLVKKLVNAETKLSAVTKKQVTSSSKLQAKNVN